MHMGISPFEAKSLGTVLSTTYGKQDERKRGDIEQRSENIRRMFCENVIEEVAAAEIDGEEMLANEIILSLLFFITDPDRQEELESFFKLFPEPNAIDAIVVTYFLLPTVNEMTEHYRSTDTIHNARVKQAELLLKTVTKQPGLEALFSREREKLGLTQFRAKKKK
jgi:hypothetical protein